MIRLNKLIKRVVAASKNGNTGGGKDAIDGNVPLIALMCSCGWVPIKFKNQKQKTCKLFFTNNIKNCTSPTRNARKENSD